MAVKREIDMLNGTLWDKILRYALPVAATGILEQLFNASGIMIVGNFSHGNGTADVAAVGSNAPVTGLILNLFIGLALGANVVIANAIGRGSGDAVRKAVHTSIIAAVAGGVMVALIGELVAGPLLGMLNVTAEVFPLALTYLRIYLLGMPVILLYNFEAAIFRSVGDTQAPLAVLTISGVLNVTFGLFFVIVCGIEGKKKRVYSSKYALSSICTCSRCGDIYRRIAWNNRGKRSNVWRCCTRVEEGPKACDAPTVQETELQEATIKAINLMVRCSPSMKEILAENIALAMADDNSGELEEINVALAAKQKELVKLAHANKDYTSLADEIDRIREKKQRLLVAKAETAGYKKKIEELKDFINESADELTDYDESLVRKYIKEIKIFDDRFQVFFKAGVDVEIAR